MTFYPHKIKYIAEKRGLTNDEMAALGGISVSRFEKALEGNLIPSVKQIKRLSDNIAVPYYAFFSESFEINDYKLVDYRKEKSEVLKYGKDAKSIYRNINIMKLIYDIYKSLDMSPPQELSSIDIDENPEQLAQSVRSELELDNYQFNNYSKKEFFRILRKKIEQKGITVVQDHNISNNIDGFALYDYKFVSNYIFINSNSRNSGRKTFTLAHELCHILGKRSAISDDYESDNEIEKYCNIFAASLLLPRAKLYERVEKMKYTFDNYDKSLESSKKLSEYFKTSVSAVLVRVFQVGLSNENFYYEFAKSFGTASHPDSIKQKQTGGPKEGPDQGAIVLAHLGERAVSVIATGIEKGVIKPMEICSRIGLSKRRIDALVDVARERRLSIQ